MIKQRFTDAVGHVPQTVRRLLWYLAVGLGAFMALAALGALMLALAALAIYGIGAVAVLFLLGYLLQRYSDTRHRAADTRY